MSLTIEMHPMMTTISSTTNYHLRVSFSSFYLLLFRPVLKSVPSRHKVEKGNTVLTGEGGRERADQCVYKNSVEMQHLLQTTTFHYTEQHAVHLFAVSYIYWNSRHYQKMHG